MQFSQLVISGIAQGCIYGLIALGFDGSGSELGPSRLRRSMAASGEIPCSGSESQALTTSSMGIACHARSVSLMSYSSVTKLEA